MNEPIDITPGGPVPPPDPVAARRRLRIGLLAAGAVASVVAGGVGYAALNPPEQRREAVSAPARPAASPTTEQRPAQPLLLDRRRAARQATRLPG